VVTLYYTDSFNVSRPWTSVSLNYQSSVDGTNGAWENWGTDTAVYIDGITELLNITYLATDTNANYGEQLNIAVTASGTVVPTLPTPVPYAAPNGFSDDITSYLAVANDSQAGVSKLRLFLNINVPGAANGTVIASQSRADPDYAYNWVRDAALTMDTVFEFYAAASEPSAKSYYETILFQYAQARVGEQNDPDLITSLGEPKFNLNNSLFTGPWGRPQVNFSRANGYRMELTNRRTTDLRSRQQLS
jgi:glucoamylase